MGNKIVPLCILLTVLFLLWAVFWYLKAKTAREAHERQAAALRTDRERRDTAERARKKDAQDEWARQKAVSFAERRRSEAEIRVQEKAAKEEDRLAATARNERERRAAEQKAQVDAARASLKAERDDLLLSIRSGAPDFILSARLDFEREYRAKGGEGMFGQEMSPLVCFGYRVGKTNGRTQSERQSILKYAIAADLDVTLPFLPSDYRREWGGPLSKTRYSRIFHHLTNMADLREGRSNFDVAVAHWRADAMWFQNQQRALVEKYLAV